MKHILIILFSFLMLCIPIRGQESGQNSTSNQQTVQPKQDKSSTSEKDKNIPKKEGKSNKKQLKDQKTTVKETKSETSKAKGSKAKASKADTSKTKAPKAKDSKAEASKADTVKADVSKVMDSKAEASISGRTKDIVADTHAANDSSATDGTGQAESIPGSTNLTWMMLVVGLLLGLVAGSIIGLLAYATLKKENISDILKVIFHSKKGRKATKNDDASSLANMAPKEMNDLKGQVEKAKTAIDALKNRMGQTEEKHLQPQVQKDQHQNDCLQPHVEGCQIQWDNVQQQAGQEQGKKEELQLSTEEERVQRNNGSSEVRDNQPEKKVTALNELVEYAQKMIADFIPQVEQSQKLIGDLQAQVKQDKKEKADFKAEVVKCQKANTDLNVQMQKVKKINSGLNAQVQQCENKITGLEEDLKKAHQAQAAFREALDFWPELQQKAAQLLQLFTACDTLTSHAAAMSAFNEGPDDDSEFCDTRNYYIVRIASKLQQSLLPISEELASLKEELPLLAAHKMVRTDGWLYKNLNKGVRPEDRGATLLQILEHPLTQLISATVIAADEYAYWLPEMLGVSDKVTREFSPLCDAILTAARNVDMKVNHVKPFTPINPTTTENVEFFPNEPNEEGQLRWKPGTVIEVLRLAMGKNKTEVKATRPD